MTTEDPLLARIADHQATIDRLESADDVSDRRDLAQALAGKGQILRDLGRTDEALSTLDSVRSRFGADDDTFLRASAARATMLRGMIMAEDNQPDLALIEYDAALDLVRESAEEMLEVVRVWSLYHKGLALEALSRYDDATMVMGEEVVNGFMESPPPGTLPVIVLAYLVTMRLAVELGQPDAAIAGYGELVERYISEPHSEVRVTVARALLAKAALLGRLTRYHEAFETYDQLQEFLDNTDADSDAELLRARAVGVYDRAYWLDLTDRRPEAAQLLRAMLDRYRNSEDPEIDHRLASAREVLARLESEGY